MSRHCKYDVCTGLGGNQIQLCVVHSNSAHLLIGSLDQATSIRKSDLEKLEMVVLMGCQRGGLAVAWWAGGGGRTANPDGECVCNYQGT